MSQLEKWQKMALDRLKSQYIFEITTLNDTYHMLKLQHSKSAHRNRLRIFDEITAIKRSFKHMFVWITELKEEPVIPGQVAPEFLDILN